MRTKVLPVALFVLAVVGSITLAASLTAASTTISTNIQTGGDLSVTGTSTFAGNVGIGTTSPSGALVVQSSSDRAIQFANQAGTPLIMIDTSSNFPSGAIGIGTTTPATALDIFHGQLTIESETASRGINVIVHAGSNQVFKAPQILFIKSRGSQVAPIGVQSGDILGYLQWLGYDGANNSEGSVIESVAAENFGSTNWGTNLDFYTAPIGSTNQTLRMHLGADGNVGIGSILSPASVLSVKGNSAIGGGYVATAAPTNGMIVQGNVGIGTTTPAGKLQVSAGASATTTVTIGELGLASSRACVNMNQADGSPGSFYIAGGALKVESNYCR
jgi:hypothetical protein